MTRKQLATGVGWAALITATEWVARRTLRRRAHAWLLAYGLLGATSLAFAFPSPRSAGIPAPLRGGLGWGSYLRHLSPVGLALAAVGYPLGRRLLRDPSIGPPPDPLGLELAAIEVVAAVEELTWGGIVEPAMGRPATGVLFALKHVAIDGRWRRGPGLFTFWIGLGLQRRRSPVAALAAHAGLNALGVTQGHLTREDRF